jgi:LPXTG-motif cell wall-anchored protein
VTVSKEFVPERADGSVIVEFEFDASQLAGRSVTAFEKVSSCGKDVFVHEDLKDQDQSIYFRRTGTSAAATGDENHAVLWTAVLVTASACAAGIIFRRRKKN